MMARRWLPVLVLVVAVGGLLYASSERDPRSPATFGRAEGAAMPVGAPVDARSSTWFCAAGQADAGAPLNLAVVIANAAPDARTARVTWVPGEGAPKTRSVSVPGNDSITLAAADVVTSQRVSAIVEVDGGGVAVEHAVSGAGGSSVAPCSPEASDRWYLANGVTEKDARELLVLFNPFPADAVVDLSFSTDQGRVRPQGGQGMPVPARSTVFVDVAGLHVDRRAVAATEVTARTGEVVVDRVQMFDGSTGRKGVAVALAAPRGALSWEFPDGLVQPPTLVESWHVYNPTDDDAEITLTVDAASGDAPGPVDLTVPAHTQHTITAADAKVEAGVAHSSNIESQNGVPIVAERLVDSRAPSPRVGWSSTLGAPRAAADWLFAAGETSFRTDEWLVVRNPGRRQVTVSVLALAGGIRLPVESLQDVVVPAGGRVAIRIGDHIQRFPLPLLVRATGKVVVERDVYGVGRVGVSTVLGIPLP
jgi:hypothetical protein